MPGPRRPINGKYSKQLKALRSFVDFDYDLRKKLNPAQKHKINRYFVALREIQARANVVYRSKDRKRVREVQEIGRNEFAHLKGFRVAFVESSPANPTRVKIRRGKVQLVSRYFRTEFIPFDARNLATDPKGEAARAVGKTSAKWFRVSTGKFSILGAFSRAKVPDKIVDLVHRYSPSATNPEILNSGGLTKNHHYKEWLNGLIPLHVKNQTELSEFLVKDSADRDKRKKARKAQKERDRAKKEDKRS